MRIHVSEGEWAFFLYKEEIKSGKGEIPQDHPSHSENSRLGFIESVHQ